MKIQKTSDGKFYRALPSNEKIKHYFVYKKSTEINQGYLRGWYTLRISMFDNRFALPNYESKFSAQQFSN